MTGGLVAGRATRDALFLTYFAATWLPAVMGASALLSVLGAVLFSGWLARTGPVRAVPVVLAAGGCIFLGEWALLGPAPRAAAWLLYLHVTALGPLLVSGFWSVVNERFDPHTAKRAVPRMAAAGALAGVAAGAMAERVASLAGIGWTLALLFAIAVAAALTVRSVGGPEEASAAPAGDAGVAVARVVRHPLLGPMALLMVLGAAIDTFLDYVLKLEAAAVWPGTDDLVRFFAAFYVACGLLAFAVQAALGSRVLQRFGLGGAMAALPLVVIGAGSMALSVWRLWSVVVARGMQSVMDGGLFRSGFELLYTPLPAGLKRPVKPWIDVAARSVGSIGAAGLVLFLLFVSPDAGSGVVVALSIATSGIMLWMVFRAQRSYVAQLGDSLRGGVRLMPEEVEDATTARTIAEGRSGVDRRALLEQVRAYAEQQVAPDGGREPAEHAPPAAPAGGPQAAERATPDPVLARVVDVCSGDPARVRRALHARVETGVRSAAADRRLAPHVVPLLADERLARDAEAFLRRAAPRSLGLLVDSLLDRSEPREVRLALAGILPDVPGRRTLEGLWAALEDPDFELRRAAAEAAVRVVQPSKAPPREPSKAPPREVVHGQVEQELARADAVPPARRLEQVFALLALLHGRETMRSTLQGVLSDDTRRRGTALELLETVLPPALRQPLFQVIERARG